jgi:acyl carrier protein
MQKIHDTIETVARHVFQQTDLHLSDETTAKDVDRWDSLSHITFIIEVERAFKLKFKNAEIGRLQSIGDLKKLVTKYKPDLAAA